MAAAHIVLADIKHRHLKLFNPVELQSYIDDANQRFEDFAQRKGVAPSEIKSPVDKQVKLFILNDMYKQIASDNIGSEGTLIGDSNLYQTIYAIANTEYNKLHPSMTKNAIIGDSVDDTSSAIVWGALIRG